jgi:hypothetical protein
MRAVTGCLMGLLLVGVGAGVAAGSARADSPFLWSPPAAISPAETYISGVSCLSTPLCVAVDDTGNVLTTTSSTEEASSWRLTHVTGVAPDGVSCVAPQFCVAVDHAGSIFTSTNAAAEPPTWTVSQNVDPTGGMSAASCVSTSFCVAVDYHGNVLTSTNPTGGPSAWVTTKVDRNPRSSSGANALYGVSCASISLCVAVDSAGNVLISTNPAAGVPIWTVRNVEGNATIYGVSCPAVSLCVAVDAGGNFVTSTDPASESPSAWTVNYRVDTHQLYGVSCVVPSTCVAVDAAGNIVSSTAPTNGGSAWTVTNVDGIHNQLNGVSCQSLLRCVAVDSAGNMIVGNPAPLRTLSVGLAGSGSGTVAGVGISCPTACTSSELNGSNVALTAAPSAGSTFVGWSGACSGTGACDLAMNSDAVVSAIFAAKPSSSAPPAGGGGAPSGGTAAPGVTNLTVAGWIVSLPTGVGVPLRCWAKTGSCATATLTLSVVEKLRGKRVLAVAAGHHRGLKRRVIVGSITITLAAGQTKTVDVMLNGDGRSQLNRFHRLSALLQIASQPGTVLWKQTVGFFQHTKRKHR